MPAQDLTPEAEKHRAVAITFDDLPAVSVTRQDTPFFQGLTNRLLKTITASKIPAIGFVNENKLYRNGRLDDARVALLQQWLDSGLELGNHTFSHPSLHAASLRSYKTDVIRGERVTSKLLRHRGMRLRYFRHPFLQTGTDLATRREVYRFLERRGYRVAPGTIGNSDWIFAAAYAKAAERDDPATAERVVTAYIAHFDCELDCGEQQSLALFGYEIKQVLLLHANALNADHLGALVEVMKRRDYSFISLAEALNDQAYTAPDTYTGAKGITWLRRWALTAGQSEDFFTGESVIPEFVMKEASVTPE